MRRDEPGEVGGRAERATVQLRQAERRVVARHDRVRVADQPDPTAQAVALHGGDDRHLTVVHGPERRVAPAVDAEQRPVPRRPPQLLDVHPRVEPAPGGGEHHAAGSGVAAGRPYRVGEVEPPLYGQGVDRRPVDGDERDAVPGTGQCDGGGDTHGRISYLSTKRLLGAGYPRR
ncbi:hypothetical protein SRIMM317S_06905 [Streptomyces rimosus subsp. rimosus]